MVKHSLHRITTYGHNAFTMIELIFAIVILAVVMLTIPMMIGVNNKALEGNAAQEAVFLVSAVLSETTTLIWDDNSDSISADGDEYTNSKILDTNTTGNSIYNRWDTINNVAATNVTNVLRKGGLYQNNHRMFFNEETHPAQTTKLMVSQPLTDSVSEIGGYKNEYTIVATREYADDTPHAGTTVDPFIFVVPSTPIVVGATISPTNIKMTQVEINATIDGINLVIARLRAFTCNIGETSPPVPRSF